MSRIRVTKLQGISKDVVVAFPDVFSPASRSKALADFAREELRRAQDINKAQLGRVPPHTTSVDGRQTADLNSVRPDGFVIFEFEMLEDVLEYIGAELVRHSPVLTGQYRSSHVLLADQKPVAMGADLPVAKEYAFVNVQPYARKIERGLSDQAPDGVYEVVAGMAKGRFGNIADIKFSFRDVLAPPMQDWAGKTIMQPDRPRRDRDLWLRRNPAIVITPR